MDQRTSLLLVTFTLGFLHHMTLSHGFHGGPRSLDDRIAIIGAGPSGIHMAYKLKLLGFKNIVVFEKRNRVGGKTWSVDHHGGKHEMGGTVLLENYVEVFDLLKKFNMKREVQLPKQTFFFDKYETGSNVIQYLSRYTGISNPLQMMAGLDAGMKRYTSIYKNLFGDFEGGLMPRPNASTLYASRGTFKDFLVRNDLEILEAGFNHSIDASAYGPLHKLAALYGLMSMTPTLLRSIVQNKIYCLPESYQSLWEKVVKDANIKIEFGVDIQKIQRHQDTVSIDFIHRFLGLRRVLTFDFLILSPSMISLMDIVNFKPDEKNLFSKLVDSTYIVSTLIDSNIGIRKASTPVNYHSHNLISNDDYPVCVSLDLNSVRNNITGGHYTVGLLPGSADEGWGETRVYHQFGHANPTTHETRQLIERNLKRHLLTYFRFNSRLVDQITWTYFTRFPQKELEKGILWDIIDMQGKYNTWYIGSSVSFESVNSVLEYNNMILRNYVPPTV